MDPPALEAKRMLPASWSFVRSNNFIALIYPEPCRCDFSRTGFFYDPMTSQALTRRVRLKSNLHYWAFMSSWAQRRILLTRFFTIVQNDIERSEWHRKISMSLKNQYVIEKDFFIWWYRFCGMDVYLQKQIKPLLNFRIQQGFLNRQSCLHYFINIWHSALSGHWIWQAALLPCLQTLLPTS